MTKITLPKEAIELCLIEQGVIALIVVHTATILHPGTRGEMTQINANVQHLITGHAEERIELRRYTSNRDVLLVEGERYVISAVPDRRFAHAMKLLEYISVVRGSETEVVEAHEMALVELRGHREDKQP